MKVPQFFLRKKPAPAERRRAQAEAAEAAVMDTLSDGVLRMDAGLVLEAANAKARELFGIADPAGLSVLAGTRSAALEALAEAAAAQNRRVEEDIKLYPTGKERHFHVSAAPLPQKAGVVLVLTEYTRLYRLERVRKDFAANVSHELRTPIQLIKGFAETLLDSPLTAPDQVRRYIGVILKNAEAMERLTADMLKLAGIEEGEDFADAMTDTAVAPLLAEAAAAVEPGSARKSIVLAVACPPELTARLYGPLIVQGVVNLLDNAVKYSPEGSQVRLSAEAQAGDLVITVRDEGAGIAAKHLPRLFERFYRVDPARSRAHGGAGLGLAIVRHIAEAHQGTASAESHAGEGSAFNIRIPLK